MNRPNNSPNNPNEKPATITSAASETALTWASNFPDTVFNESQLALSGEDELVSSLTNAYENRRARQVFEWEVTRRRAVETNAYASNAAPMTVASAPSSAAMMRQSS